MPLASGTKLGPYEILSAIGAGGMGEVYKARDSRLERTVAIKIVPEHLSRDADLKARFEREARNISQLQHPHICTLYDIGNEPATGVGYLVLEYLEGETLADRIARGPVPLKDVLRTGAQIAEALERAHRAGIVHRDLKPGNIMLTAAGAKLLDFGLAKPAALTAAASESAPAFTAAVTMTTPQPEISPITQQGMVVGTFQYMSPEQIQGRPADGRSDIFALGAVLYEMATGKRAFEGKSQLSVASAILEKDPEPISAVQPLSPPALDHVVATCLAKNPEERWQSASDIARELRWISSSSQTMPLPVLPKARAARWPMIAGAILALLIVGALLTLAVRKQPPGPVIRASIVPPEKHQWDFAGDFGGPPVISPDGTRIAFSARGEQGRALFVHDMSRGLAQRLLGTEDAAFPFWSPDSRQIGFFSNGQLRRVAADGGPVMTVADAPNARGGAWTEQNAIIFTPDFRAALYLVGANGGTPRQLTNPAPVHTTHRWPVILPGGKHFLYFATNHENQPAASNGIYFASFDGKVKKQVPVPADSHVEFANGKLFYHSQSVLVVQDFDPDTGEVRGEPITMADGVQTDRGVWRSLYSVSQAGTLIYHAGALLGGQDLLWFDRTGKRMGQVGERASYGDFDFSPDARTLVAAIGDPTSDLWTIDLASGRRTRLTFGDATYASPVWSPDGKRIAYTARAGTGLFNTLPSGFAVYVRSVAAGGEVKKLFEPASGASLIALDWSPDGKYLLSSEASGPRNQRLLAHPLDGGEPLLITNNTVGQGRFSPDGRWVVYDGAEGGGMHVYVAPFPALNARWQISQRGGFSPQFSRDGKELYYIAGSNIVATKVRALGQDFETVSTEQLPIDARITNYTMPYQVLGDRILVQTAPNDPSAPLTLVVNWPSLLEKR